MATATYVSITDFGAKGDGYTDNTAAIQRAFDYARAHGLDVKIPAGTFMHSGVLRATSIDIFGEGDSSVLKASVPSNSALYLNGNGVEISNLKLACVASSRMQTYNSAKLILSGTTNFTIENIKIEGSGSAGIIMDNAHHGTVRGNSVTNTNADSIHMVNESGNILVEKNRVVRSGDDGISVVSYQKHGGVVKDIVIRDNVVMDNKWARGITVVGGENVQILNNDIKSPADRAGVYVASESAYSTFGAKNILVQGNHLTDAGGTNSGHGSIMVYNSGTYPINGVVIRDNHVDASRKSAVLVTGGNTSNVLVEDNAFDGAGSSGVHLMYGPKGVVVRDNIYEGLNGPIVTYHNTSASTVTVQNNSQQTIPPYTGPGTPPPTEPPPPNNPPPVGDIVIGTGPDAISLKMAAQSFQGDPQFELYVDGVKLGTTQTVTVQQKDGWQTFIFKTDFAVDPDKLSVRFLNDNYVAGQGDRNLVVGDIQVNGSTVKTGATLVSKNGDFLVDLPNQPAPVPPGTTIVGTGPDAISVKVAADSYQGDPAFRLLVDGKAIAPDQTVAVQNEQGWHTYIFKTDLADNADRMAVQFLNDLYGGSADKDRNLHVGEVSLNGKVLKSTPDVMKTNGSLVVDLPNAEPALDTIVVRASGTAWNGAPQFRLLADGKQVGAIQTVAAKYGAGWQDFTFKSDLPDSTKNLQIQFLNDAYGGIGKDRNLYVHSVIVNGENELSAMTPMVRNGTITMDVLDQPFDGQMQTMALDG
ncbi:MAG TPA: carbohydrate-binding domain-containing protein [Azospirillaceae bacterium]|nr:carbohydrate-binding domain-containing protein [Azospirillaceae bacterium]